MLALFPYPYPDELLYSVFSRYYVRTGYSKYVYVAEELFESKYVRPSFEYLVSLKNDVQKELTYNDSFHNTILSHTMYPYHCRFLPLERRKAALESLGRMDSNYHNLVLLPKRDRIPVMRYCPECAKQDRLQYGETYWHRIHQIWEMTVCPIHHCYIQDTEYKLSGKVSPDLIPAEIVIPFSEDITQCNNERLLALAEYVRKIFCMPIKMDMDLSVSDILKRITEKTMYRTPRGEVCRITALYKDLVEFYRAIVENLPQQWQIHKVITGQRYDFWEIVLLAFFLEINPFELQRAKDAVPSQNNIFDDQIRKLHESGLSYPQIATQMGVSLNTIKNAAYLKTKKSKPRKRRGGKPGRRPLDWDSLDSEMLAKVVETITELKSSDKPQRITVGGVARLVGLKSKQIDKLTQCKAEIEQHCQSQEEFWAQIVLWAWGELSKEGKMISIKQIRMLTNMSTGQINRCLNELKNKDLELFDEISKLLNTRS